MLNKLKREIAALDKKSIILNGFFIALGVNFSTESEVNSANLVNIMLNSFLGASLIRDLLESRPVQDSVRSLMFASLWVAFKSPEICRDIKNDVQNLLKMRFPS